MPSGYYANLRLAIDERLRRRGIRLVYIPILVSTIYDFLSAAVLLSEGTRH